MKSECSKAFVLHKIMLKRLPVVFLYQYAVNETREILSSFTFLFAIIWEVHKRAYWVTNCLN